MLTSLLLFHIWIELSSLATSLIPTFFLEKRSWYLPSFCPAVTLIVTGSFALRTVYAFSVAKSIKVTSTPSIEEVRAKSIVLDL